MAYLGPPVTLADCVLHHRHSLLVQSWAPSEMRGGATINADGFGIGWLDGEPARPGVARRYRRQRPMWSDTCLPDVTASVTSGAVLAAVRSATAGMAVSESACAPFVHGSVMFSHNGVISGWPESVAALAARLPPVALMTMEAPTDSAFLWALVAERLRDGQSAATALAGVVAQVLAVAPRSRLNLLLNDGQHVTATTVSHSLWVRQGAASITVSSEALDPGDQRWQVVPDLALLQGSATGYSVQPLLLDPDLPGPTTL
jgi:glutamine amidotransferase